MTSPRPYYHEFAWAYDLLQSEDVPARVDFMQTVLAQNGIVSGSSVLDAGCGSGRYATEFARRGFKACGVDRSTELIAVAQRRENTGGSSTAFVIADLLTVTFCKAFHVVLCRGVLNDFVTDAGRDSIFRQFTTWLLPNGILFFDVREWAKTVARYAQNPFDRRTVEFPNGSLCFESETLLDHGSRQMLVHERFVIDKPGESGSIENDFVMRPWTPEEISTYLRLNALQELGIQANYGEANSTWSDRLVITARKPAP